VELPVLEALGDLPRLERLVLDFTNWGDLQGERLTRLPAARVLSLRGTRISDHTLRLLAGMKQIGALHVEGTAVTAAGVDAFRRSRPDVELHEDATRNS
jgi:hypothetical protein